jgi:hypothetical protein
VRVVNASQCLRLARRSDGEEQRAERLARGDAPDHVAGAAVAHHGRGAAARGGARCLELRDHPAAAERALGSARGAHDRGPDVLDHVVERRRRLAGARRLAVQPVDVGDDHEQLGADQVHDRRGEIVVVAEADLLGGDRVVLVHDRHHAEPQQRVQRVARVEEALALLESRRA